VELIQVEEEGDGKRDVVVKQPLSHQIHIRNYVYGFGA
jgi:hypothetical protein